MTKTQVLSFLELLYHFSTFSLYSRLLPYIIAYVNLGRFLTSWNFSFLIHKVGIIL